MTEKATLPRVRVSWVFIAITLSAFVKLSLGRERDFVRSVEFRVVVQRRDPEFERMFARFDSRSTFPFRAFEHAHQLAVDIGVNMLAAFTFGHLELKRNLIAIR